MAKKSKTGRGGPGTLPGRPGVIPVARSSRGAPKPPPPLYSDFGDELEDLPDLAEQIQALNAKKKAIDDDLKPLLAAAKGLMESVDDKKSWSVRGVDSDWVAIYIKPNPTKKIVPELLIQQGVTMKQIKKATKETPKKGYLQVRPRNEAFESNGDDE